MKSFLISSSSLFFISLVSTIPSSTGLVTFQAERKALIFHTKSQNRFAHCHTTKLHGLKGTADESRIASNAATKNIALSADEGGRPGTATLDVPWEELGFEFRPTKSHLSMTYKDGMWGPMELHQEPYLKIHMGATALHYGQSCFEGLKAFAHQDGSVHVFRPDENAKRMASSCSRVMMPFLSEKQFLDAIRTVVRDNIAYVPPYGSNGALYLRPLLFGSGPRIGLQPADEYTFLILVIPVGDYYKGGLSSKVDCIISSDYDRAAP